jgi:alpha-mannosidase
MKNFGRLMTLTVLLCLGMASITSGQTKILWQIGKMDDDPGEFAPAPIKDCVYTIGVSESKRDWPGFQPAPDDKRFGGDGYGYTILFGVKNPIQSKQCRLVVDLFKHDRTNPTKLRIDINGHTYVRQLTKEGGVGSIEGSTLPGVEFQFEIIFPGEFLKAGQNQITITTLGGAGMVYDWLGMESPEEMQLTVPPSQLEPLIPLGPLPEPERKPDYFFDTLDILIDKDKDGKLYQPISATIRHSDEPAEYTLEIGGVEPIHRKLDSGIHTIEALIPAIKTKTSVTATLKRNGETILSQQLHLTPVRTWEIYVLMHSLVNVGFTDVPSNVGSYQWKLLEQVIDGVQRTANYPPGARFKWNTEVLFHVESYLEQASPEKRKAFIDVVKKGSIDLNALFCDELTGLCQNEELFWLLSCAHRLQKTYGIKINTAMLDDVPSCTWGMVSVLADSGIKYFAHGPYGWIRIGNALKAWGDRPFYWVSPSGRDKVLVWPPRLGFSTVFRQDSWKASNPNISSLKFTDNLCLRDYLHLLEQSGYPYDMVQIRQVCHVGVGKTQPSDFCEFVKTWNATYAYPKFIISTVGELFGEFERRYSDIIPAVSGDFMGAWEDGAASSAKETGVNRVATERLSQAETLWAMLDPKKYPADRFYAAWRNAILYDECAWISLDSISHPDNEKTKEQWRFKQAFALDADAQSCKLINEALSEHQSDAKKVAAVDVFNTSSWPRTDIVLLPKEMEIAGDIVKNFDGKTMLSQRLSTGELAFLARDIPPFGAGRFSFHAGEAEASGNAQIHDITLNNDRIVLNVDKKTGAISSLKCEKVGEYHSTSKTVPGSDDNYWNGQYLKWEIQGELVDRSLASGLNDYFYIGNHPEDAVRNGPVTITPKEKGPLVASLVIESEAPGCHKLTRELRLIDGLDRVDIINVVDKKKVRSKEGVHFSFPFNVPDGVVRMDVPFAVVRPEADQLCGANRNFFSVQRWVDVSNQDYGITWATIDAPLVEIGAMTAPVSGGEFYIDVVPQFMKSIRPSQTLYSYVMNNYWFTNYKADQEGPTVFRYSLRPHARYIQYEAQRFGIERCQPLIAVPVDAETNISKSLLSVEPASVIVTALKPSEDGKSLVVRLFNTGGKLEQARLTLAEPVRKHLWLSNFAEENISKTNGLIELAPYQIVALKVVAE